jgi:hypothetical protein
MNQFKHPIEQVNTSTTEENGSSKTELLEIRVKKFCEKIQISPIGEDGKIDQMNAVYHRSSLIRDTIHNIL